MLGLPLSPGAGGWAGQWWPEREWVAPDTFTSGEARDLLSVLREKEGQGRRPESG